MERMDDQLNVSPQRMENEDYAEWIRARMWRRVVLLFPWVLR